MQLTNTQQNEFAVLAAQGSRDHSSQLISSLEGLCHKVAHAHKRKGIEHDDLVQEARMAVIDAARTYDAERGTPFIVCAKMRMRAACQVVVQKNRSCSGMSRVAHTLFSKLPRVARQLQAEGLTVTPEAVASALELKVEDVKAAWDVVHERSVSTSAPLGSSEGTSSVGDTLVSRFPGQHQHLVRWERAQTVRQVVAEFAAGLSDRDSLIFSGRLACIIDDEDPTSGAELGDMLGMTKQRVGQIERDLKVRLASRMARAL
jgi:RNA polymerase sigma factor for flagellar operon FliA